MTKVISKVFSQTAIFLLVLLWVYAAVSKLIDFRHFKYEMHNQALLPFVQEMLIYCLPPAEIIVASFLLFEKWTLWGLYCSAVLLGLFTIYISFTLLHFFKYVPCSCGGILEHMGWLPHLFFNLFFLLITLTALYIKTKERSVPASSNY
jgi:putative oxidoreductase